MSIQVTPPEIQTMANRGKFTFHVYVLGWGWFECTLILLQSSPPLLLLLSLLSSLFLPPSPLSTLHSPLFPLLLLLSLLPPSVPSAPPPFSAPPTSPPSLSSPSSLSSPFLPLAVSFPDVAGSWFGPLHHSLWLHSNRTQHGHDTSGAGG